MLLSLFVVPDIDAVRVRVEGTGGLEDEINTITRAAERNGCYGEDYLLLLAIRKAENGRAGRQFGILHPKALAQIAAAPGRSLDIQAGWAGATIVKNRRRWQRAGCEGDFIDFLGDRYCPKQADEQGNFNWKKNVRYWFERFKDIAVEKWNRRTPNESD